jgi:hypothetical protein
VRLSLLFASAICAGLTLAGTPAASAADAPRWATVSGWDIRVDTSLGHGCFASTNYDGGSLLRIGFDRRVRSGYLFFGHPRWQSLQPGQKYPLAVQFGQAGKWDANMVAIDLGGASFLVTYFSDLSVFDEFMKKKDVRFFYRGEKIAELDLKGSSRAFAEVVKCQRTMEENGAPADAADPFAEPSSAQSLPDRPA